MYCYVYKITDKKRKKYYIGSRQSAVPPKQDLGIKYFSSSTNRKFIKEQEEDSSQFEYEVIKEYPNILQALEHEKELLQRVDARNNEKYYNGRTKLKFAPINSRVTKNTVLYLGNLIKIARKERGFTQEELGERINASRSLIQRIESGNAKVAIGTVFEACYIVGIPLLGCDEKHVNNLTRMLSYMNRILPVNIPAKNIKFDDNF